MEEMPEDLGHFSVPCPGCSGGLENTDQEFPTCSKCRIIISVSAATLAESYQVNFTSFLPKLFLVNVLLDRKHRSDAKIAFSATRFLEFSKFLLMNYRNF